MSDHIVPQRTVVLSAEKVSFAHGAMIVSMHCPSEKHYQLLSSYIERDGVRCNKVSYHPDTNRAFYRSQSK